VPVSFNENSISFEFAAINYTSSSRIKYAYQLVGFDKEWRLSENQRSANYNSLKGGHYTFKVKAMNADGLWSETMATVGIEVKAPFWQTWWFRLLFILTLSLLITILIRRRIAAIRKESIYKQQRAVFGQKLAETEMMALRAQMNPHFIFNCMNIIDGLITDDRKEDAQDFLQKFSRLIRLVLENSQHQLVLLQQDLQALKLYIEMEAIRSNHHFSYEFDVDEELIENDYKIPPLLLQPYVENAIVHGLRNKENGGGKLLIGIKNHQNKILITVEDNGIGRKKAMQLNRENRKPHDHLGMKVTGKRIDLLKTMNHNQVEISISDVYGKDETGTRVEINLPYSLDLDNR
jgi:LytS/YehU family sensor histidine kinase